MSGIWEEAKREISLYLPQQSFTLWINPIEAVDFRDNILTLGCPNKFSRNWVMDNYLHLIRDKLSEVGAPDVEVLLEVGPPKRKVSPLRPPVNAAQLSLPSLSQQLGRNALRLNNGFTFERFVVGQSNEFAYSVSRSMAHGASSDYRSLLMLAGTGLGKSHLSQAVGRTILQGNPACRVYYLSAEEFTNELVFSIKNQRVEEFKEKYRKSCDVLLLEGIHFFGGKEKTQIELGHTLDALASENKKLIFTSALPPKDIPNMSMALSSRISAGIVTVIERPEYETRMRILETKAEENGMALPGEIIQLLAARLDKDVRQMESALKCLKARSELMKARIDLALAEEVLKSFASTDRAVSKEDIIKLVCTYYKTDPETLRSKSRKKNVAYPRNVYIYLCRHHTDETLEDIARSVNRSHSTVLYAAEAIVQQMRADNKLRGQIQFLSKKIEHIRN
jgi:chromosomal replication initiator protein